MKKTLALAVTVTLWAAPGGAQETIASDRPGVGSGSFLLEAGTFQLEMGAQFSRAGPADLYDLGQLLVRMGVPGPLELQVLGNSFTVLRGGGGDAEGLQDLGLGAKVRILGPGAPVSLSALGTVSFPTGDVAFTSDETLPTLTLLADLPLGDRATLSGNLGYTFEVGNSEGAVAVILTPSFSLSETTGVYAGYAGSLADSGDRHFLEGGVTWLSGVDLQLDLNGGVEVDSGDFFIGAGVAARHLPR